MTHIVNEVMAYDKKRWKVTLDEGALTFLLYPGEAKRFCLHRTDADASGQTSSKQRSQSRTAPLLPESKLQNLSEAQLQQIKADILLPRAEKRALYYLKNGEKSEHQIRQKLEEGLYPEETIEATLEFLRKHRLADDTRLTENYIDEMKGSRSRREMEAKLYQKGLKGDKVKQLLSEVSQEDEYSACEKALRKHPPKDKRKDAAYLMRKGFSWDAVEHALQACAGIYELTQNLSEDDC